eukprot:COSAG06_NODE_41089_length_393_cov_0.763514_1_plen_55_part_01
MHCPARPVFSRICLSPIGRRCEGLKCPTVIPDDGERARGLGLCPSVYRCTPLYTA